MPFTIAYGMIARTVIARPERARQAEPVGPRSSRLTDPTARIAEPALRQPGRGMRRSL